MEISEQKLPHSHRQFTVTLTAAKVATYFDHAVQHLAPTVKVAGFRAGKAPPELIKQQLSSAVIREEASSLAVRAAWQEIIKDIKEIPIEDPSVSLEEFDEGEAAKIIFEFDIRPEVKVANWQKIKIKPGTESKVTDAEVADLIKSLSQAHATTVIKLDPAVIGDRMELDFEGSIGNVRKDKLSAKNFPVIIGQGTTIPGFDDHLAGLKKGGTKTFQITFPKDHFDKELAGNAAEFKVMVNEVFKVILPELNKEFAKKFGHDTVDQIQKAIRDDLQTKKADDAFISQKAKWLAEFEQVVTVDVPASLIEAEVERSRQAWRHFLQERHLNETDWLTSRQLTIEGLEKDWQKAAESSVKIGLGLAEVAKELKKEMKSNDEFQILLDELVEKAMK